MGCFRASCRFVLEGQAFFSGSFVAQAQQRPRHQAGHNLESGDARGESAKLAFGGLVKIVTRKGSHESGRDLEHIL